MRETRRRTDDQKLDVSEDGTTVAKLDSTRPSRLGDFPPLSRIPGYQLLVHSTMHACQHIPPRSTSPTTKSHVKHVCCKCRQGDVFRTVTPREGSESKQG